jgi:hypothetical protein
MRGLFAATLTLGALFSLGLPARSSLRMVVVPILDDDDDDDDDESGEEGQDLIPGEGPALGTRITQEDVESGRFSQRRLRREGMRIFSTPFNRHDGFGDGPMNVLDPTSPGGRPTMAGNGTFLRVNGLDSQTCLECHGVLSTRSVPARFAVGGAGGISAVALGGSTEVDIDDEGGNGFAFFNGRMINPPFVFGAGGIELVSKEMTTDLQRLGDRAQQDPGVPVELVSKGVHFGSITFDDGTETFDTSAVEGVDGDLVVRPFGRKGNNFSVRAFAIGAMQFHHGIQPVEVFGEGVDADGDGVVNEILAGELSAIHVFASLLERPRMVRSGDPERRDRGFGLFEDIGCATCHVPSLRTDSNRLNLAFPEVETNPDANVYMSVRLSGGSAGFKRVQGGGIAVEMFSDLKRHDMGDVLAEVAGDALDRLFITARLWGVADSAPYMHDGRALSLREAVNLHDGEARTAAGLFEALSPQQQETLLFFLNTLRVPDRPNRGL